MKTISSVNVYFENFDISKIDLVRDQIKSIYDSQNIDETLRDLSQMPETKSGKVSCKIKTDGSGECEASWTF